NSDLRSMRFPRRSGVHRHDRFLSHFCNSSELRSVAAPHCQPEQTPVCTTLNGRSHRHASRLYECETGSEYRLSQPVLLRICPVHNERILVALLEEVFGVSAKSIRSYVERTDVDNRFLEALVSDKEVIVYGSSKQGKTALVSKYLPYDAHILVSLTPK